MNTLNPNFIGTEITVPKGTLVYVQDTRKETAELSDNNSVLVVPAITEEDATISLSGIITQGEIVELTNEEEPKITNLGPIVQDKISGVYFTTESFEKAIENIDKYGFEQETIENMEKVIENIDKYEFEQETIGKPDPLIVQYEEPTIPVRNGKVGTKTNKYIIWIALAITTAVIIWAIKTKRLWK